MSKYLLPIVYISTQCHLGLSRDILNRSDGGDDAKEAWPVNVAARPRDEECDEGDEAMEAAPVKMKKAEHKNMTLAGAIAHGEGKGKKSEKHRMRMRELEMAGRPVPGDRGDGIVANPQYVKNVMRCNQCCLDEQGYTRWTHTEVPMWDWERHVQSAPHRRRYGRVAKYMQSHGEANSNPHRRMGLDLW
jgi:hypothetical protein